MAADSGAVEVGCATGEITRDLTAGCGHITGIEDADAMIEVGRAKAKQRGIGNDECSAIDPADDSLAVGSFDVIVCYSVFHLCDDYRAMLRRLAELLRPGGHVLNETPCLGDWGPHWKLILPATRLIGLAPRVRLIKVAELESAFAGAGLAVLESTMHNPKSGQHNILARKA